jgi:hypothetical protein
MAQSDSSEKAIFPARTSVSDAARGTLTAPLSRMRGLWLAAHMGQELTAKSVRSLRNVLDAMAVGGTECRIVMVDGQLVPPSHQPVNWNEVRLRAPAGMITLRKNDETVSIVVFGNADASLAAVCTQLAAAFEG